MTTVLVFSPVALALGIFSLLIYLFVAGFILYHFAEMDPMREDPNQMIEFWEDKIRSGEDLKYVFYAGIFSTFWPIAFPLFLLYWIIWPVRKIFWLWSMLFVKSGKETLSWASVKLKPLPDKGFEGGELSFVSEKEKVKANLK